MKVSVITPSFRSLHWLRLNVASVADQDCEHEHLIQDACSDDGTAEWVRQDGRAQIVVEKDRGMYDAVNRGLRRASGEILCYLNCDEQYLPGALQRVTDWFERHPDIDVLFGDAIVVDPDGGYLCERRSMLPTYYHTLVSLNLSILTCATFFRRRLITERGLYFDERLKDVGDGVWTMRLLREGVRMALMREFTSTFTDTGDNMNTRPNALREKAELLASAPRWARWARHLIIANYRLRRLRSGVYTHLLKPCDYAFYTPSSPGRRISVRVSNPTYRWPGR